MSVASSYVEWAMSGGARVVPIIIGRDEDYYRKVGVPLDDTPGMTVILC